MTMMAPRTRSAATMFDVMIPIMDVYPRFKRYCHSSTVDTPATGNPLRPERRHGEVAGLYPCIQDRAYSRAQQSADFTDSTESAADVLCAWRVSSINSGISEKEILRSRNASTAISSAALSTAGAVPPIFIA